ncbi:hypothetical protein ACHHYP_07472 [Achlya hypogyna]|uniref:Uncharacterized protein n=1 Tax=Achlya hypogyna TaxID=1202772 RepID=A0A1V9ZLZ7_ACHHY|nr:hypothetical protein ACHHYP_07472 [Achlya hypogyna]
MTRRPAVDPLLDLAVDRKRSEKEPPIECRTPSAAPGAGAVRWHWLHTQVARKVVFTILFFASTFASSSIAVDWITDALAAHRSYSRFSIATATTVLHESAATYEACINDALFGKALLLTQMWERESSIVATLATTDAAAVATLTNATAECTEELQQLQAVFASAVPIVCEPEDQFALETLNNAWTLAQPATTAARFLHLPNEAIQTQLATVNATLHAFQEKINADMGSLTSVVAMGASSVRSNFDGVENSVTTIQAHWSSVTADTLDVQSIVASLQGTKQTADAIAAVLEKAKPVLQAVGVSVPSFSLSVDIQTSIDQLLLLGSVMNGSLMQLSMAQNATVIDVQNWHDGLLDAIRETNATILDYAERLAATSNTLRNGSVSFANWTLRTQMLVDRATPPPVTLPLTQVQFR